MPRKRTNPKVLANAKELRRNLTQAEAILWSRLRNHQLGGVGFRRQHAIGPYIVDFCAPRIKLIIELDGSQHLDQEVYDRERAEFLAGFGYKTIRFWNGDVFNHLEDVLGSILVKCEGTPTRPPPNQKADLGEEQN